MPLPRAATGSLEIDRSFPGVEDDADAGAFLKPIIAGARARGVADGLEMLGVGAVLIDATGRVLHAGGRARRLLGGHAQIVGDHLIAECGADNAAFQTLIGDAIGSGRHDPDLRIVFSNRDGRPDLLLRAIRFPAEEGAAQRLRAVLVLEQAGVGETMQKAAS